MDEKKASSILSFLNLLSSDLGLEDFPSLKEAQQIVPILVDFVKTGQLKFIDSHAFDIHTALTDIASGTGNTVFSSLNLDAVEEGSVVELAKLFLALIFSLRISHNKEFDSLVKRLSREHSYAIVDMVNALDDHLHTQSPSSSSPLTDLLMVGNGKKLSSPFPRKDNLQIFSSTTPGGSHHNSPSKQSMDEEEASKYKIKSAELEARLKQLEALNSTLNEQLSLVQSEYSDMEHKYESMKSNQARKQELIEELQAQLKEAVDESEMMRYENSQLQRELKNATERSTKTTEKLGQELKGKESEMSLLYRRLDDYVKQLAAKESLENRVKFLDQQMTNHQGIQRELREDLEKALNRANIAETELNSLKKQMNNALLNTANTNITSVSAGDNSDSLQNDVSLGIGSAVSLHDELNSTMFHSAIGINGGLDSSVASELSSSLSVSGGDDLAHLRTRIEMLERENRELKKTVDDGKRELDTVRSVESQSVMDKALEIERLKQECETLREEFQKLRRKEASISEKCKSMEDENEELRVRANKLEESLDKAAAVIEEYSTASEKHCSAAELLQLRHELTRAQEANQLLLNKMDQFKHEATQEQRLITTHWYNAHIQLLKTRHGLGNNNAASTSSSNFVDPRNPPSSISPSATKETAKSFLRRQLDTTTTSARFKLLMFLLTATAFCYFIGLVIDINYDYDG